MILYPHMVSEIKVCTASFNFCQFSHICNLGNCVAHNLTRHARHVNGLSVWMEDVSSHIKSILLTDFG